LPIKAIKRPIQADYLSENGSIAGFPIFI